MKYIKYKEAYIFATECRKCSVYVISGLVSIKANFG
jgi:hypothetical protein